MRKAATNSSANSAGGLFDLFRAASASTCQGGKLMVFMSSSKRTFNSVFSSRTGLGRAYSRAGKSADAVELIRRSIALREAIPDLKIEACIDLARDHAFLASIAVDPLSGLRTRAAAVEGDRAMAALLRATDAGYRNFDKLRTDPYLRLLRDRADFRVLLLDLAFPNDPFTQGR